MESNWYLTINDVNDLGSEFELATAFVNFVVGKNDLDIRAGDAVRFEYNEIDGFLSANVKLYRGETEYGGTEIVGVPRPTCN